MSQLLVHSSEEYEVYLESRRIFTCKAFCTHTVILVLQQFVEKHGNCQTKKL